MATTAETLRAYRGLALFSYGFRPFFLGGAIWAAAAMALFAGMLWSGLSLPSAFGPVDWHAHELLYGFLPAIVAGFLLTAVPNWTGRLPVAGAPLAVLALIWLAGRAAVAFSEPIGAAAAAIVDLVFLAALIAIIAREIVAGKNLRNLKVLALVSLLLIGNAVFHIEAMTLGAADYGKRLGVAAAIMLIVLIGGRIVPSFTRNWLAREKPGALPEPFNRFDAASIALAAVALAAWVAAPESLAAAALLALAGAAHLARLLRWRGWRTFGEPLVAVLHAGYAFVPFGFFLAALHAAAPDLAFAAAPIHGWTAGAVGLMTLAVMTRASLGHTGRELTATPAIVAIYAAVGLAALARVAASFGVEPDVMVKLGAAGWIAAFGGFAILFGPMLLSARRS